MKNKLTDTIQSDHKAGKEHSGLKHLGMMLICCLIPLMAAFLLKQMGYSGMASYLVLFLCPLMHLFMMKGMLNNERDSQSDVQSKNFRGGNDG